MAVTAYSRLRMLWGALDWQAGSDHPYTAAQTSHGGTDATTLAGGIGVRRAVVTIDRSLYSPADDAINCHFDWLNTTAGAPDDTWTSADYTTLETAMSAFFTSYASFMSTNMRVTQYAWYRHGPGITPPNPAERTFILPSPIAGINGSPSQAPQVACSMTFRTAVRRSWGRTYLPIVATPSTQQRLQNSSVTSIAGFANTLIGAAASSDFRLVVVSMHLSAALNVEQVEVDDVLDVVRRRRWKHTTFRAIVP